MIRFACPACRSLLECPRRKAGEKVACPKCGQRLQVPPPMPSPVRGRTMLGRALGSVPPPPRAATPPSARSSQGNAAKGLAIPTATDAKPDRSFARAKTGLVAASIAAVLCVGTGLALWVFSRHSERQAIKELNRQVDAAFRRAEGRADWWDDGDDNATLSPDEQMAWNKLRRQQPHLGPLACMVVEYNIGEKRWRQCEMLTDLDGADDPTKTAQEAATLPAVKVAVVIDLYSHEQPTPLIWCHDDDGGGVRTTKRSPFPELDGRLRALLTRYQKTASDP